jgi:hypothetical protein
MNFKSKIDEIEFILKELIDNYNIAQEQNMKMYEERYFLFSY